ncbi:MAG: RNA polymerase sigma factor [Sandaracinaceae bacterium]
MPRPEPRAAIRDLTETAPAVPNAELVRRAREGERWAEEALYRRHVRRVSDATCRVLGRSAEAEDVVQETFLKCFDKLGTLRRPELFDRWLMRIAMNKVRSRLRRRKVLRRLGLDRGAEDATLEQLATPDAPSDVRAQLAELDGALSSLAANHRMAWMLHVVEGLSLPETADACGCSLATCKRWIRAAREQLDVALGVVALGARDGGTP